MDYIRIMNHTIIYRNFDRKVIRKLLLEIGKPQYERALENMQVRHPPISMEGWYLEADRFGLKLCHRYPIGHILKLMDVDKYRNIPREGWERIKTE